MALAESIEGTVPGTCIESISKVCEVCQQIESKYKCPRCKLRTCSLSCCNEHKLRYNCDGKCDTVTYCRRENYDAFHFQRDYRLLEDIDRNNAERHKQLLELSRRSGRLVRKRKQLIKVALQFGITLRLASSPVFKRSVLNHTYIKIENGSKNIWWSVEFYLLPINNKNLNLSELNKKSLHIILHNWEQNTRLCTIWNDRLLNLSSEEQDSLVTHTPVDSPPFGKISTWLNTINNKCGSTKHYFYVKVQEIDVNSNQDSNNNSKTVLSCNHKFVEIFSTNRLSNILIIPGVIVHEMPIIWVSHTELTNMCVA